MSIGLLCWSFERSWEKKHNDTRNLHNNRTVIPITVARRWEKKLSNVSLEFLSSLYRVVVVKKEVLERWFDGVYYICSSTAPYTCNDASLPERTHTRSYRHGVPRTQIHECIKRCTKRRKRENLWPLPLN